MRFFLGTEMAELSELPGQRPDRTFLTLLKDRRLPRTVLAHDDRQRSCEDFDFEKDYYHVEDFMVGATINVFGRPMLICDVDDKTQEWYATNMGVDQRAARVEVAEEKPVKVALLVPPHNGIGSEEDTLNALKSLVPKPLRKDFAHRTGHFVRYKAKLVTTDPIDTGREFLVMYYTDDKEVSVYEKPARNTGLKGGTFLRRLRARNPATGEYYALDDFVVGRPLVINAFTFMLHELESEGRAGVDAPTPECLFPPDVAAAAEKATAVAKTGRRKH